MRNVWQNTSMQDEMKVKSGSVLFSHRVIVCYRQIIVVPTGNLSIKNIIPMF